MEQKILDWARELMREQTYINKAPSWLLTEMAVSKGGEMAIEYGLDQNKVKVALYLAHTIFDPIWGGEIQKNHPKMSSDFVRNKMNELSVDINDIEEICLAILEHHKEGKGTTLFCDVVKNAECIKFVSVEGSLIWLHELGLRGISYQEAKDKVIRKMLDKKVLLTLDASIKEAEENIEEIKKIFGIKL